MKKYVQVLIVFLFIQNAGAQVVFCPPGAEWHYTFYKSDVSSGRIANETVKYVGDSVENNESFKILSHNEFFKNHTIQPVGHTHIKQSGDTIFLRNFYTNNNWQILYNFAASVGQSWTTIVSQHSTPTATTAVLARTYTITVDSIGYVNINNFNLKRLYVRYSTSGELGTAIITERLGCETFLFNYRLSFPVIGSFLIDNLCYQDSVFGLKQFTEKPCDYTFNVGIKESNYQNKNIKIYPNPAAEFFLIDKENEAAQGACLLSIHDLSGREIKRMALTNLNSDPTKIDIKDLAQGFYVLKVLNNNEVIYTGNLIKVD